MERFGKVQRNIIPEKEDFYSHLNMEDITHANNAHSKRVPKKFCKQYIIVNLLLTDVVNNFRNMCLEIYELDPVKFLSAPGLIWEATLKNTKVKLDFLTDIDMLLMVEKGIRRGICHTVYQYAKANNKYMENFDKNQEPSYLQYWDVYNL